MEEVIMGIIKLVEIIAGQIFKDGRQIKKRAIEQED